MTITCKFFEITQKKVLVVQGTTLRCFPFVGFSVAALKSNSLTVGFDVPSIWALLKLTSAVVSQQQNGDLGSFVKSA